MRFHCRQFIVEDGRRRAALLTTPTGLCEGCQRWVRASMRALPDDWLKLELTIGEHRALVGDKTRRPRPGSKVPINVATDDLMRRIVEAAHTAAALVAKTTGARWRGYPRSTTTGRDYRLVQAAARLVAERVDVLIAAEDGGLDAAIRIVDLHRQAVQQLGETRQRERQHLPCPSCGVQALVREVQDRRPAYSSGPHDGRQTPEVIRCLACDGGPNGDGTWTETEYRWLSTMVISEREEHNMLKWLLAEAQWERDIATWLAAEREWVMAEIARMTGMDGPDALLARVRAVTA
ncbi:hypothetical protein B5566_02545 [Mycobacterium sp. MHSD3]|nr:hypothetical protein B5566_02545 [Mycobacterium sp. MHSD3]